jgi:hypothetical protein
MIIKFICGHEGRGQLPNNQPSDHIVRESRMKCPGCNKTPLMVKRAGLYTERDFPILRTK